MSSLGGRLYNVVSVLKQISFFSHWLQSEWL